ncbi:MAG: phenylalanine--tRNA ligase subunit beta [Gemmatimonadota bacterium]
MLYSHDWLRAIVPHNRKPDEVRDLIGRHVATVDEVRRLRAELQPVVVARVVRAVRHPNSDRLWLTRVDDGGGEELDVVCGAQNVTEGKLYPFARTGTTLPGGLTIEKRKIRGETSNGMLCSPDELGLGSDHSGIMELDTTAAPGTPLLDAIEIGDVVYDVDVLPNRPDLLSHLGMARELSALTGTVLRDPLSLPEAEAGADGGERPHVAGAGRAGRAATVDVSVEDVMGCPRYLGVVIRGVTVAPSPDWLVRRLESVGARPISNIVDVTNYALHAVGQPMHAFDVARLKGPAIIVRRAAAGETLVTLDGVERRLDGTMTVIADAGGPVAIAGVMGGLNSEVTAGTRDVFLEVASFSPRDVRRTRRSLGLSTDASYRFERGTDALGAKTALQMAAAMIIAVAGGSVDGDAVEVIGSHERSEPVQLNVRRLARLLGDEVTPGEVVALLSAIGFRCDDAGSGIIAVTPPSWRHDVERDVDLVEEIARLRGYDVLSDELAPFRPGTVPDHPLHEMSRTVRDLLIGRGFMEVRPLPFVAGSDSTHESVRNPLAEDTPHLRTSLLETLAGRAEYNLARARADLRLFEIGSAFAPRPGELPDEQLRVGVLLMGPRRPPHFSEPQPPAFDLWDARAMALDLARTVLPSFSIVPGDESADRTDDVLWRITSGDDTKGVVRRLRLDGPVWAPEAWAVELALGRLSNDPEAPPGSHSYDHPLATRTRTITVTALPVTPAAEFDLALLVPDSLTAAACEEVLRSASGELLESLRLFDEFRGAGVPEGHRSVAWRLTFRDPRRTLRDKEVEGRRAKILQALERELGVRPRTA